MLTTERLESGGVLVLAGGTLTRADHERCVAEMERAMAEEGTLRVLVRAEDVKGWTPAALWEELKFDLRHHNDFTKLGVVGDNVMIEWGMKLARPFFSGEIKRFDPSEADAALEWLRS